MGPGALLGAVRPGAADSASLAWPTKRGRLCERTAVRGDGDEQPDGDPILASDGDSGAHV